jgi:hypothetical protein
MMAKMYDGSLRQIVGTLEIHHSYNMLLGRSWIYLVRATTSSLYQCLKYIMNGMLVIFKAKETIFMIRIMVAPLIEVENCRDENIYTFKIINTEWAPENTVLRKSKIYEATSMTVKCFLTHGIPFQFNLNTGMLESVYMMKMKCVD